MLTWLDSDRLQHQQLIDYSAAAPILAGHQGTFPGHHEGLVPATINDSACEHSFVCLADTQFALWTAMLLISNPYFWQVVRCMKPTFGLPFKQ